MITFIISIVLLLLGYFLYSKLIERLIGVDPSRTTPAVAHPDGVDYVPMKPWRIFLIQFLNIAGVGPIIGAVMGAQFGTASFLWIVFGCIFAGAVHDFIAGFISIREDGASLPEIHGKYLGNGVKQFMRGFTVLLMILVGAVFVNTPATLIDSNFSGKLSSRLHDQGVTINETGNARRGGENVVVVMNGESLTPDQLKDSAQHVYARDVDNIVIDEECDAENVVAKVTTSPKKNFNIFLWVIIIFAYYLIATLLPIDKLIGKIYPVFGFLLLGMAVAILVAFIVYQVPIPEVWERLDNQHPAAATNPIFPMMFISIACGAISGFHATQSPLMARCMVNEKQARPIFYGAMITEGVVALIWAAAATYFFHDKADLCMGKSGNDMIGVIANEWFPKIIAVICILGVISAAVTSGDTALRSARLIVADFMHVDQKPVGKRLLVALPVFLLAAGLLVFSLLDAGGFQVIWRYFSWANQVLAMVTLWSVTVFIAQLKKGGWYWITLVPALFMTMVTVSFIFVAQKEGLGNIIPHTWGYIISAGVTVFLLGLFISWRSKKQAETKK
ncbi:MAG: carbon starvation protein A [Bacteroidales bacterium]|nr:carbon starvation protein A [Bacteroidales bacterium]